MAKSSIPIEVRRILPADTRKAWETLAGLVPKSAYLVGGTAVAVHLQHRDSRDLDFYLSEAEDLRAHHELLQSELRNEWAASLVQADTLKGFLGRTKVEFFHAINETPVAPLTSCGGLAVASLKDLMAMKLGTITRRGALRDYLDLMEIEKRAGLSAEEGIGFYLARYRITGTQRDSAVAAVILALGEAGVRDAEIDPAGVTKSMHKELLRYWARRQPQVARRMERLASSPLIPPAVPATVKQALSSSRRDGSRRLCGALMPRAKTRCVLPQGHRPHHRSR